MREPIPALAPTLASGLPRQALDACRNRWVGENMIVARIAISGAFLAKELSHQTPLAEAANARIHEIRLLDWTNECLCFR